MRISDAVRFDDGSHAMATPHATIRQATMVTTIGPDTPFIDFRDERGRVEAWRSGGGSHRRRVVHLRPLTNLHPLYAAVTVRTRREYDSAGHSHLQAARFGGLEIARWTSMCSITTGPVTWAPS
jgi:hypothetical protein